MPLLANSYIFLSKGSNLTVFLLVSDRVGAQAKRIKHGGLYLLDVKKVEEKLEVGIIYAINLHLIFFTTLYPCQSSSTVLGAIL